MWDIGHTFTVCAAVVLIVLGFGATKCATEEAAGRKDFAIECVKAGGEMIYMQCIRRNK